ncbi:MAG: hypothetical protein L6R36_007624 [Xanthoria steineri]|nr:MAG: hypothetical protein L6R36_007624 [Xanthoria steineri]
MSGVAVACQEKVIFSIDGPEHPSHPLRTGLVPLLRECLHFIRTPFSKVDRIAVLVYVVLEDVMNVPFFGVNRIAVLVYVVFENTINIPFFGTGRWIFWAFGGRNIILFEVIEESLSLHPDSP